MVAYVVLEEQIKQIIQMRLNQTQSSMCELIEDAMKVRLNHRGGRIVI